MPGQIVPYELSANNKCEITGKQSPVRRLQFAEIDETGNTGDCFKYLKDMKKRFQEISLNRNYDSYIRSTTSRNDAPVVAPYCPVSWKGGGANDP